MRKFSQMNEKSCKLQKISIPPQSFAIYGIYVQPAAAIGDIARFNIS